MTKLIRLYYKYILKRNFKKYFPVHVSSVKETVTCRFIELNPEILKDFLKKNR